MQNEGNIIKGVEIFETVFGGDGVARLPDGEILFVPFSAPGDIATVEITEAKKSFCRGVIRSLETASPLRDKPVCPFYGRCGGCAYQHLTYDAECQQKSAQFKTIMQRIGKLQDFPEPEAMQASSTRYGYRNKLRLEPFQGTAGLSYGFCERDNATFFPLKQCPLAMDSINKRLPAEIQKAKAMKYPRGRHPYTLTLRTDSRGETASYLGRASAKLKWFMERLLGNEVSVPVGSFWQVNPATADMLFSTLKNWLLEYENRSLIDAYAGVGTFSLALGNAFQYRAVIENDEQAIAASKYNHEQLGLKARFCTGNTEALLGNCLANVKCSETTVILDPPRTGCLPKVLTALLDFKPSIVAYVSCNPTTLARDLNTLCANGAYVPVKAGTFNMFPATAHFESAVLLRKS
ncbi:MAG: class I SAM-dependent RNA methyltransferase [Victivallales bacterium]|nr:class I SAM-dependent RNA methyltransferase [Victivallales bacterium]